MSRGLDLHSPSPCGRGLGGGQRQANLGAPELARTDFNGTVVGLYHVTHDGQADTVPGYRLIGPCATSQDLGDLIGIDSGPVIFDLDCQASFFRACKDPYFLDTPLVCIVDEVSQHLH